MLIFASKFEVSYTIICLYRPDPSRNRQCPRQQSNINFRYVSNFAPYPQNRVHRNDFSREGVTFNNAKRMQEKYDKRNKKNLELFKSKLQEHIQSPNPQRIHKTILL